MQASFSTSHVSVCLAQCMNFEAQRTHNVETGTVHIDLRMVCLQQFRV